jgi:DNA polymerase-3 subunit chi
MAEVRFYHLQRARLEEVLPVILERCHQRGDRTLVLTGSAERAEALAALLWTYRPDSFLPHGTARDGAAADQPIYLTPLEAEEAGAEKTGAEKTGAGAAVNPNSATVLMQCDGAEHPAIDGFKLVCTLFDGHDEAAVAAARAQWKRSKEAGHAVVYYQQADSGKWQETARG